MTRRGLAVIAAAAAAAAAACGGKKPAPPPARDDAAIARDAGALALPPAPALPAVPTGLPAPALPATVTPEAVALGERLFWEPRLSRDGKTACASCHDPAHGYASGERRPGANGKLYPRRAPSLVNLAWHAELGWDGRYPSIAAHLGAHVPGQMGDDLATAVARLGALPVYRALFERLGGPPTAARAAEALGAFVLTRYDGDAPWDRAERAASAPAALVAGYQLFQDKAQCAICHTPPLYTDLRYHRLGLIASPDEGRGRVDPAAKGAFKTPSLRGAALRTGFFHDGSARSLDAAIDWHLAGGTGQGADPSIVDLRKIALTPDERAQLAAFVRALTDPARPPAKRPALP